MIIKHNIVHMRTVFACEKVRGRSGGVLTWYHGLGGGRLFGEGVFQSMGCLLEKIWYLPHTCTVVAFASGMFLFWKILTCSIPKDTYKKVIERDYLWIWVHLYETILLLGKNCGQKLQMPVWSFGKLSLKSQRSVPSCNACGRKGEKQIVLLKCKKTSTPLSYPKFSMRCPLICNSIAFSSSVFLSSFTCFLLFSTCEKERK